MRKTMKKIVATILTAAMAMTVGMPAFAEESGENDENELKTKVSAYVQNWVNENYTEHYTLSDYQSQITGFNLQDDNIEAHLLVEVYTTLKYNSVDELPYMQGVKSVTGVNSVETLLLSPNAVENSALNKIDGIELTETQKINFLKKVYEQFEDASACIGVPTLLTVDFVVKADIDNSELKNVRLFEESGGILFPAKPFDTARELQNKSVAKLTSYLKSDESKISITTSTRAGGYDRVAARDYANKYTSNGTNACKCGSIAGGSSGGVNYDKWNNSKYPYQTIFCHNDCADFVSQALAAGGIPTNSSWERGTNAWQVSRYLCEYMVNNDYAIETTFDDCVAGHMVKMTTYSNHMVLCTLNDTIDHRYSGHTNDRLNAKLNNVSSWVYYRITY